MYPYALIKIGGEGVLYFYDLLLSVGIIVIMLLADKLTVKSGFSVALQRLVIICAVAAVVIGYGSAVLFQAFYNYLDNPSAGFHINEETGATFLGGLIGGAASFLLLYFLIGKKMCKAGEEKKRFGTLADIAAICIPLAHGFGRLGCLMAGCCHGAETDAWYGIYMQSLGAKVVPLQLFEALFLFAVAGGMYALFLKNTGKYKFPLLPAYCAVYGIWRFFLEFARADERGATIVSFLSPSQLVSLLMIIGGGIYLAVWLFKRKKSTNEPMESVPQQEKKD